MMPAMSSGDLDLETMSETTGIPARTIRSYISRGLVPKPIRPGRGATYPPEALNRLRFVQILLSRGLGLDLVEQAMRSVTDEDIASVVEDGEELRIGFLDNLSPTTKRRGSRSAETESETLSRLIHALRPLASPRTPRRNSEAWIRARVTDDLEISVRAHPTGHVPLQLEEVASLLRRMIDSGTR